MQATSESIQFTLHQQAVNAIIQNPHLRQRKLLLRTDGGTVTLKGTVQSYFEKQMAQEALKQVQGVRLIENELEVSWTQALARK